MLLTHHITPDIALIAWTATAIAAVVLIVLVAERWWRLGRERALTPALSGALFVAVLTLIWVIPGLVAAVGAVVLASARYFGRRHRSAAS